MGWAEIRGDDATLFYSSNYWVRVSTRSEQNPLVSMPVFSQESTSQSNKENLRALLL